VIEPFHILLVEDNPGDIRLTQEALKSSKLHARLSICRDGVEAITFLQAHHNPEDPEKPDLILLDLNLPRKSGHEVLAEIKGNEHLRLIPVVILTTSDNEEDILHSYNLHANCYVTKPVDMNQFLKIVQQIEAFWFAIVKLP
jgi:two-component system response regulator